jgi:hypothetical protein
MMADDRGGGSKQGGGRQGAGDRHASDGQEQRRGQGASRDEQDRAWHAGERGMERDPSVQRGSDSPNQPGNTERLGSEPKVDTGVSEREALGASGHAGANSADREPAEGRRDI